MTTQNKLDRAIADKWWKNFAHLKQGHQFNLVDACADLYVGVSCNGDPNVFANITFSEEGITKTEAELITHRDVMQSAFDAKAYAQDRISAYPSIEDQLDMQYHDKVDGTTTWQDAIQAVKDANPK